MGKSSELKFGILLLVPLIVFVFALDAFPMLYSIWVSLFNMNLSVTTKVTFAGFDNYAALFRDPVLLNSVFVTLRFTIESGVMTLVLSLGMALLLNQTFRGRGLMRAIVLLPWALSTYVVATIFRYVLSDQFGLLDSLLRNSGLISNYVNFLTPANALDWLAIAFSWNFAPLGAYFLLAALQVIPVDMYRSAKIDGAGPFQRFYFITIPYIRHATVVTLLLVTIAAATETSLIIGLTGGGPGISTQTLTFWIFTQAFTSDNFGYSAAISWMLVLIVLVLGILYLTALNRGRRGSKA